MQEPTAITPDRYREIKASPDQRIAAQAFICRHCHKHFRIGSIYTQFCSDEHEAAFHGKPPPPRRRYSLSELLALPQGFAKICPGCNEWFEPRRRDQIFCLPKCRTAAFHAESAKWHERYLQEKRAHDATRQALLGEIAELRREKGAV